MSTKNPFYLLWFLVFFSPVLCHAQWIPKVEIIKFNEGLPSDFVKSTSKNKEGIMYVATQRGISIYDGYRFIKHRTITSDVSSLILKNGIAYYYDTNGLCCLKNIYASPTIIAPNQYTDENPNNDHYDNIYIDNENRIWCTDLNNIKYFVQNSNKKASFEIDKTNKQTNNKAAFFEPNNSQVWCATRKGLFVFDKKTKNLKPHSNAAINRLSFTSAFFDGNNLVYLSDSRGRLIELNTFIDQVKYLPSLPEDEIIQNINQLDFENKKQILVNSEKKIYILNPEKSKFELLYDAKNAVINHVQVDNETNTIFVSTNRGLVKLTKSNKAIRQLKLPEETHKNVIDIVQDSKKTIWLACQNNHIWSLDSNLNWKLYTIPDPSIICNSLSIYNDIILISTTKGLYQIENQKIRRTELSFLDKNINIKKSLIDNKNQLWILPVSGAMKVYDYPSLKLKENFITNTVDFWKQTTPNDLLINTDGKIWLAGWMPQGYGIAFYNPQKKYFEEICRLKHNANRALFIGDYYNRISTTKNGNLLFSGYGGWNLVDASGSIKQIMNTRDYAVANDRAEGITQDLAGNIWFATAEGLNIYSYTTDKVTRITQIDGLPTDELINGFCKLSNGDLALGIENGILIIDVKKILKPQLVNKLELTSVKINGKAQPISGKTIELAKEATELVLSFSALSFSEKQKVIYRYKFEGENSWNYLGNNPELSLIKLAPGNYKLIIEAGDNLDNWQQKTLDINLIVHPPFYLTWWFLLLFFIVVGLIIYSIIKFLLNQQRIKNDLKRKIKDAEMQTLRSQMNPHFMFNTLNSINSYIIQNKTEAASEYLTTFSKLMRNILDNSKQAEISLDKEITTLRFYLELEAARLEHSFDYFITIEKDLSSDTIKIPPLILQPFVENSIWHGLRNKKQKGRLHIFTQLENDSILKISITDDGIGRTASALLKTQQVNHKSYGMDITINRLKMLDPENQVIIKDLFDTNNNPTGTQVQIIINL